MSLNKEILKKLREQTSGNEKTRDFLSELFTYESGQKKGWYKKEYREKIEKYGSEK